MNVAKECEALRGDYNRKIAAMEKIKTRLGLIIFVLAVAAIVGVIILALLTPFAITAVLGTTIVVGIGWLIRRARQRAAYLIKEKCDAWREVQARVHQNYVKLKNDATAQQVDVDDARKVSEFSRGLRLTEFL
jgi:hypothetical protein